MIDIPHLKIRKLIVDPEHTKQTIIYLLDQFLRNHKQTYDFEWCLVNQVDGKKHTVQQPVIPMTELLPQFIWSMYYHRSKAIIKFNAGLRNGMFGDDPHHAQIIIKIDGKNYDFDDIKKTAADQLRTRIVTSNQWIEAFREMRNKDLISRGDIAIGDEESSEFFQGYDLPVQLHLVDCIYENVQKTLGAKRLKAIRQKMKNAS